jgi:hypothetical protein
MAERTIADEVLEAAGIKMGEFKPYCKRCGKPIIWGELMGQSEGVSGTYYFHEDYKDCGILENWFHAGDHKPEDD